jgi:hypothetical protein
LLGGTESSSESERDEKMAEIDYPACIRELYESEIFGEALTLALVAVSKSDRERYHNGTLLQLETETKARLRPFLYKYGISPSEETDLAAIPQLVASYEAVSWREFMGVTIPVVQQYLARFKEIARAGSEEDQEYLQSMIRHEASILRWMEMEAAGETEGSLDAIIEQLQFPLPVRGA